MSSTVLLLEQIAGLALGSMITWKTSSLARQDRDIMIPEPWAVCFIAIHLHWSDNYKAKEGEKNQWLFFRIEIFKDKILANQVSQAHEWYLVVLTMSPLFDLLFWADREEDGLFADDDEEEEAQLGVPKQFYYDEYDDPYDILKMMMNYVDNDAGTCLHLATKVSW